MESEWEKQKNYWDEVFELFSLALEELVAEGVKEIGTKMIEERMRAVKARGTLDETDNPLSRWEDEGGALPDA